jgi:glucose/mannose transport system permease protein
VADARSLRDTIGLRLGRFAHHAVLLLFAVYYLTPLAVMVLTSLKSVAETRSGSLLSLPNEISFDAWITAWDKACVGVACDGLAPYFWNSVLMVVPSVIVSTAIGALNGYALTKWRFRGANLIFALILLGSFVPAQIVVLPMAVVLGRLHLVGTTAGLVLVHVIYGLPFTTLFFRNYFVSLPDELVKAATMDGAGFFQIFRRIMLPLARPIVVVTVIWQFTQVWNDFLFGVSFAGSGAQPITVALNNLANASASAKLYNVDMAAALIAGMPTLAVYVLAGRPFVRGLTAGPVRG